MDARHTSVKTAIVSDLAAVCFDVGSLTAQGIVHDETARNANGESMIGLETTGISSG
jgi:hypothetical protein